MLAVLTAASVAVSAWSGLPLGWITFAFLVGLPILGTIITIDDDFPGGWSNPDGKSRPEWTKGVWYLDIFFTRGSVAVVAFAFEYRAESRLALELLAAAAVMAGVAVPRILVALRELDPTDTGVAAGS